VCRSITLALGTLFVYRDFLGIYTRGHRVIRQKMFLVEVRAPRAPLEYPLENPHGVPPGEPHGVPPEYPTEYPRSTPWSVLSKTH
jgi:hypothetical protein